MAELRGKLGSLENSEIPGTWFELLPAELRLELHLLRTSEAPRPGEFFLIQYGFWLQPWEQVRECTLRLGRRNFELRQDNPWIFSKYEFKWKKFVCRCCGTLKALCAAWIGDDDDGVGILCSQCKMDFEKESGMTAAGLLAS